MNEVDRIISECVDTALSASNIIDKETFYTFIKQQHAIEKENIGGQFEVFHKILKELLGAKHYRIEQLTVRTLHERTKRGIYSKNHELIAFDRLVSIFIKDAEESINIVRKNSLQEVTKYIENLEKTVKETQAKLRDTERLAVIGQTAAMVGHDIRNPLQAITGDLYLLKDDLKDVPSGKTRKSMLESIEAIDMNVMYINKIVSDLQDYTRPLKPNFQEFNLKDMVSGVVAMLKISENIKTEVTVDCKLTIKSDATLLRRVLTNLILNSAQAMNDGGKLTVLAYPFKGKMIMTVKDSGLGISEEVKKNLFTPLFTTKSKGQGLGLAVVKRLVETLGGSIGVESEEGNGAQFIIELPCDPSIR